MKKTLSLILVLTLLAGLLAACGQTPETDDDPGRGSETEEPAEPQEPEEPEEPDEPEAPEPPETPETPETPEPPEPPEMPEVGAGELQETVLLDQDGIKITATKLETNRSRQELTLLIENSTDQELTFYSNTLGNSANSVNGWMVEDGYLNATVAAGKKSFETVYFDTDELTVLGITELADITMTFEIKNSSYDTVLLTDPLPILLPAHDGYDYAADTYQEALLGIVGQALELTVEKMDRETAFDNSGIKLLSQAVVRNSSGEYVLLTEVANTSEREVSVALSDFILNGLVVESSVWTSSQVSPGKRAVISATLSSMLDEPYREPLGITEPGALSYEVSLEDAEGNTLLEGQELSMTVTDAGTFDDSGTEVMNDSGVRVIYKGLFPDAYEYSDDIHMLFVVENSNSFEIRVDDAYGSLAVNGFMIDGIAYSTYIPAGRAGLFDLELDSDSLADIQVTGMEGIQEVEFGLEVEDSHYKEVAEATIKIENK